MKKTRKNMLRSSAAMLLVSALALTTATYAWFTKGNTGSVTEFTITAESASGIELSANAEDWYTALPVDELKKVTSNIFPKSGTKIQAVSTSTKALDGQGNLKLYALEVDPTTNLVKADTVTEANTNCIKFAFYVKNESATEMPFYLNLEDSTAGTATDTTVAATARAVRVAFIDQGSVTIGQGTYIANVLAKKEQSSIKIWEPNATSHNKQTDGSNVIATNAINASIAASNNVMLSDNIVPDNDYTIAQETTTDTTGTLQLSTLKGNTITKITVYVWLEGQDVDCTNQAALGSVAFNLKFKVPENATN